MLEKGQRKKIKIKNHHVFYMPMPKSFHSFRQQIDFPLQINNFFIDVHKDSVKNNVDHDFYQSKLLVDTKIKIFSRVNLLHGVQTYRTDQLQVNHKRVHKLHYRLQSHFTRREDILRATQLPQSQVSEEDCKEQLFYLVGSVRKVQQS